jgi:hypothetical protein
MYVIHFYKKFQLKWFQNTPEILWYLNIQCIIETILQRFTSELGIKQVYSLQWELSSSLLSPTITQSLTS